MCTRLCSQALNCRRLAPNYVGVGVGMPVGLSVWRATQTNTHIHTYTHTHTHTHTHTRMCTCVLFKRCVRVRVDTHAVAYTHTHTHTHTRRHRHTHTLALSHTRLHTHTHTYLCRYSRPVKISAVTNWVATTDSEPCVAACCSVLQCVAVCCSVLQCVAVCCSVGLCLQTRLRILGCFAERDLQKEAIRWGFTKNTHYTNHSEWGSWPSTEVYLRPVKHPCEVAQYPKQRHPMRLHKKNKKIPGSADW